MLRDVMLEAGNAMQHNRRRATLTMLGMAWGIATVVLLLAYGSGFERAIDNIFANWGTRIMGVMPGRTSLQAGGSKAGVTVRLKLEDVDRLQNDVPLIRHITPDASLTSNVQFDGRTQQLPVDGFRPAIQRIRNLRVDYGRFLTDEDELRRARVAVLSSEAKTKLFSGRFPVGEQVRIGGISFLVAGVLEPKMQEGDDDNTNRQVYIPFSTMGDLKDTEYIDGIWFDYEGMNYEGVEHQARSVMAAAHQFNPTDKRAVWIFNAMQEVTQFHIISTGLKVLLGFIGLLTLGIGGIGLMNIMLVSVTQRTREIGIEKALGAQRRHILLQFLAEAMAITFAGGVLGIVLAYGVSLSVGRMPLYSRIAQNAEAGDIRLIIEPANLLVATGILIAVGLVSGMLPALRAASLDPVEALRYE
ncbi:MAG: ABC transporter permease [Acidobacteria bacterium]|nr:ABC transporter permease [Acidobacteriota bacterium]